MTIQEALTAARTQLVPCSTTPELDAEVLLATATGQNRELFYQHLTAPLAAGASVRFSSLLRRRQSGEPVAYLTGHKAFCGLDFFVDRRVLIPRPETELLIDEVLKKIPQGTTSIADIGTDSGCIAITLASNLPRVTVYATDVSQQALTVAKRNAKKHKVKITFLHGDLLTPLKDKKIDILVANLPYGWKLWKNNTAAETRGLQFEPEHALFTQGNGLFLYQRLFRQVAELAHQPKLIIGEFDPRQKNQLQNIVSVTLPDYTTIIKKDLAGHDRIALLQHRRQNSAKQTEDQRR